MSFKIKISDSYCEWEYPLDANDSLSIDDIHTALCSALGIRKHEGKHIAELYEPLPVYEDVELTRWECDKCGNITRGENPPELCGNACSADSFTLLTGTRKVEKPQPRERSVSVEAQVNGAGYVTAKADDGRFTRIAFYDYPECHGKRVTLTATWQE